MSEVVNVLFHVALLLGIALTALMMLGALTLCVLWVWGMVLFDMLREFRQWRRDQERRERYWRAEQREERRL